MRAGGSVLVAPIVRLLVLVLMVMVMMLDVDGNGSGVDVGVFDYAHTGSYRGTFRFSQMPMAMVISKGRTIR